jgi:hypothetical protein
MGRRTAGGARVVPVAEATASSCSSSLAVVFTPVVPVVHVADDRDSGAASSARYRDGHEYVSHLPSSMGSIVTSETLRFVCRRVEVVVASSSHGIEEPAPAQPNEPVVASPDASAGTSCCRMPGDSQFFVAQAACLQCPATPSSLQVR